jgi:hypothetical protein
MVLLSILFLKLGMTANALSSCFSLEFEEGGNIRGGSGS